MSDSERKNAEFQRSERKFIDDLKRCLRMKSSVSDGMLAYIEEHFCSRNTWVLEVLITTIRHGKTIENQFSGKVEIEKSCARTGI